MCSWSCSRAQIENGIKTHLYGWNLNIYGHMLVFVLFSQYVGVFVRLVNYVPRFLCVTLGKNNGTCERVNKAYIKGTWMEQKRPLKKCEFSFFFFSQHGKSCQLDMDSIIITIILNFSGFSLSLSFILILFWPSATAASSFHFCSSTLLITTTTDTLKKWNTRLFANWNMKWKQKKSKSIHDELSYVFPLNKYYMFAFVCIWNIMKSHKYRSVHKGEDK